MIKVEGYSNIYRDPKTGAIINKEDGDYNKYFKLLKSDNKK